MHFLWRDKVTETAVVSAVAVPSPATSVNCVKYFVCVKWKILIHTHTHTYSCPLFLHKWHNLISEYWSCIHWHFYGKRHRTTTLLLKKNSSDCHTVEDWRRWWHTFKEIVHLSASVYCIIPHNAPFKCMPGKKSHRQMSHCLKCHC